MSAAFFFARVYLQGLEGDSMPWPWLLVIKAENWSAIVGMKGEPGIVGNQGRKGDKGEKGESAKASQASVVPQTNWKQCVWKSASDTDKGKIKVNKGRAKS